MDKLVNGELIEMSPQEIAELESTAPPPLREPVNAVALAQLANSRIDAGIAAGYDAIKEIGDGIGARMRQRREISTEEIEQQLAALTEAVLVMIRAQRTVEPPHPPPVEPLAVPKRGARR